VDRETARIYEAKAAQWIAERGPRAERDGRLSEFAAQLGPGSRVADLGCGPGWYARAFAAAGHRAVCLDVSAGMLAEAKRRAPRAPGVRADLAALPFARGSLDGAWAANCYPHLPLSALPGALAELHGALAADAPIEITLASLEANAPTPDELQRGACERRSQDAGLPGRLFSALSPERARALLEGAGFEAIGIDVLANPFWLRVRARRARTLPDLVRPGLRVLVVGLNPSLYSADRGLPFARPGNRFWRAAVAAGWVARERDVAAAFAAGIGFTDLVKRATARAGELSRDEYAAGLRRVEALARELAPGALCLVGLDGFRRAAHRRAQAGWIAGGVGGRAAYLMPSTSGLNASASADSLAAHLRTALAGPR
jgi:TDG/mug DNA glycosylase family protein